jgi:ferredoxin
MDMTSEGICLILGDAAVALPLAARLADHLNVTVLLPRPEPAIPGPVRRFDILAGRLRRASGVFGGFSVTVDEARLVDPAGRGELTFGAPRDGGTSDCDVLIDVSGNPPLFPAHEKRDGYLRADPGDPLAVERLALEASQMVGTFEKTLHVALEPSLCAHSRARQTGCTRCLDACPTGAILPDGDHVAIDPAICAGCGACSALCPSGAITYEDPPFADALAELRLLSQTYHAAGGVAPRLLVHDPAHGREMIALAARFGRGLPADVIPLELPSVAGFGHAEMLAALGNRFAAVHLLASPRADRDTMARELALAGAILDGAGVGAERVGLIDAADPDAMSDALYAQAHGPLGHGAVLLQGQRRDTARLAARALAGETPPPIPLPEGAPYGAVLVDQEACTLCLSCAGLCPSAALEDNPDKPQLRFREDACLQCGLCANVCPENAITLEPRFDLSDAALTSRVLHEEEPYPCIECGKEFGVKSTIERIVAKLEGRHAMFTNSDNTRLIRMCDDCRVKAQYHDQGAPFAFGARPKVRTTDDYLREREEKPN